MTVMVMRARSGCKDSILLAAGVLLIAGVLTASLVGLTLGAFGASLDLLSRDVLVIGSLLTVLGGAVVRRRPWQLDRETTATWLAYEDWRTATLNGVSLGVGFTTRLGVWLYYLIPIGAIAAVDAVAGAAIFATYAFTRLGLSLTQTGIGSVMLKRASRGFQLAAPVTDFALFLIACYVLATVVSR